MIFGWLTCEYSLQKQYKILGECSVVYVYYAEANELTHKFHKLG